MVWQVEITCRRQLSTTDIFHQTNIHSMQQRMAQKLHTKAIHGNGFGELTQLLDTHTKAKYKCISFYFTKQYEMLDLFSNMNSTYRDDDNLKIYLLECAFSYLNRRFGTTLSINNNYATSHNNDASDVQQILDSIANERKRSGKKALIDGFKSTPHMRILTRKLVGSSDQFKCTKNCMICYCQPQMVFRKRFYGANIYAINSISDDEVKCLLCEKEMKQDTLDTHLDNGCIVFKPLTRSTGCALWIHRKCFVESLSILSFPNICFFCVCKQWLIVSIKCLVKCTSISLQL